MEGSGGGGGVGGILVLLIQLAVFAVIIAGLWKTFVKAGHPGWGAIVPIYNLYLMTKIAGRPAWWMILCMLPIISIVGVIILMLDIAKAFGKGAGFGIGLALLGPIFFPILGFGDAKYLGAPKAA